MNKSLYERLGGNKGIHAIISDALDLHLKNPLVSPRFQKSDASKLKRLAHEFFCAGAGGPETYSGRDLLAAHAGMNISEQEYMAVVDDILEALTKHDIPAAEQNEVLAILYSLKGQVIRV